MTMNGTWGYKSYDHNWKPVKTLVRNLVDIALQRRQLPAECRAHRRRGISAESIQSLKGIGEWMKVNGEAIYGTKGQPAETTELGPHYPQAARRQHRAVPLRVRLAGQWLAGSDRVEQKVKSASVIGGNVVKYSTSGDNTVFTLPAQGTNDIATVIKVEVEEFYDPFVLSGNLILLCIAK